MKRLQNIRLNFVLLISALIFSSFQTGRESNINEQDLISKANLIHLQYPSEKI